MTAMDLRTVVLRRYPTRLGVRAKQHNDELLREFTIIATGRANGTADDDIPARLITVMDTIRQQYGAGLEERDARLFAAVDAGVEELDIEQQLPQAAVDAAGALSAILDEADAYCRQGRHLLTLATPADIALFRRWYIDEVTAQLRGADATDWPAYAARSIPSGTGAEDAAGSRGRA